MTLSSKPNQATCAVYSGFSTGRLRNKRRMVMKRMYVWCT